MYSSGPSIISRSIYRQALQTLLRGVLRSGSTLFVVELCFMVVYVVPSYLFLVALWSPAGKGLTSWLCCLLCFVTFPNVSWSTSELRAMLAPWNWFKPSSKIFLQTVPRRYFFCGSFILFLLCVCYAFVRVCLLMPSGHLLGKSWPLGSRLWCLIVSLLLSHWYLGSGVVLDCIDSTSLPSLLLLKHFRRWHYRRQLL